MFSVEVTILGLALAIDAAVVAFALGILHIELPVHHRWQRGGLVALIFGFFQFAMLWLGSFGGYLFSFSSYGYLYQIVVAVIFLIIGIKFLQESFESKTRTHHWGILSLVGLALATSVDALAAGISFGTLPTPYVAASAVGVITFFVCAVFYVASQFLKSVPDKWLYRLASLIFVVLGGHIFYDTLLRGRI